MPIPLPNLDDRTFDDLVAEMQARIARYAPDWTNHNTADPGIMLLELFAWLTEVSIYRVNRVPDTSRMRFLQMLGGLFEPAKPAMVRFKLTTSQLSEPWTIKRNTVLTPPPYSGDEVILFETVRDVTLTESFVGETVSYVTARQSALVENEYLGTSDGAGFQLFVLGQPFVVLPEKQPPARPRVEINGEPWIYKANFAESRPDQKHFTVKAWLNAVGFGNGKRGLIPPKGARISVAYRHAQTLHGFSEEIFLSNGKPDQYYRLQHKLLTSDLAEFSIFEPVVEVNGDRWRYRPRMTDMTAGASEFTVEPERNGVRFGDKHNYGKIPPRDAEIRATYRYTLRPIPQLLPGSKFSLQDPELAKKAPPDLVIEVEQVIASGCDATDIDEAHMRAQDILKSKWRAVSTEDFEKIVENSDFGIARARCLPGRNVDAPDEEVISTGHVSVVVVPEAIHTLDLKSLELETVLGYCPDGSCVVGLDKENNGRLILLEQKNEFVPLEEVRGQESTRVEFSPGGERLLTVGEKNTPVLRDTKSGQKLATFQEETFVTFSPTGRFIVETDDFGEANLWDAGDATIIASLSQYYPVKTVAFGADDELLATAGTEEGNYDVHLWETIGGVRDNRALPHQSQVLAMVFSPDARQLITADEEGDLYFWHTKSARLLAKVAQNQKIHDMIVSSDGKRLVTRGDGEAWLWSTRSHRKMVDQSLGAGIKVVRFSEDGIWLSVSQDDGVMRLWNARYGTEAHTFNHETPIHRLGFSPNNRWLVTLAGEKFVLRRWNLQTEAGEFAPELVCPESSAAAISLDGSWFCCADDHLLQQWSTDEQKPITVLYHDHTPGQNPVRVPIRDVQSLANGDFLYVTSEYQDDDGKAQTVVHLWNSRHVQDVYDLLNERRLVTSQHHVAGPTYKKVQINTVIAPSQLPRTEEQLQKDAADALYGFFHPLHGGPDGQGWPWGRDVFASEIYQILEEVEGVDHVEELTLFDAESDPDSEIPVEQGGRSFIPIRSHQLVNFDIDPKQIRIVK